VETLNMHESEKKHILQKEKRQKTTKLSFKMRKSFLRNGVFQGKICRNENNK
jgi:hypothetical protein